MSKNYKLIDHFQLEFSFLIFVLLFVLKYAIEGWDKATGLEFNSFVEKFRLTQQLLTLTDEPCRQAATTAFRMI